MIYFGNISNTQTRIFVESEFKSFAHKDIDFIAVDHTEIHTVVDKIQNNKVIIYFTDEPPLEGLTVFFDIFKKYPHKHFCMLNDIPNWCNIAKWPNNVTWIYYSFSLYSYDENNPLGDYRYMNCLTEKNLDSEKIGICLNRLPRPHRLATLSYMLGIGLDDVCEITAPLLQWFLQTSTTNIMDVVPWDFGSQPSFKQYMLDGWQKAQTGNGLVPVTVDAYPPYDDLRPIQKKFTNALNYDENLKPLYKNSFIEFIMVTVYDYNLPWICEKTLNSTLGSNFPIWVAGQGTVEWFRDNQFDVFDDVINHDYDKETDPVLRIEKCIKDNELLLNNPDYTKHLWIEHKDRFKANMDWHIKKSTNRVHKGRALLQSWIDDTHT